MAWPHHLAVQPGRYADPRAMNDQLHDLGYKVLGYLHPDLRHLSQGGGSDFSAPFRRLVGGSDSSFAAPDDLLIKHRDGSPYVNSMGFSSLDLSDPRAIDWWRSNVQSVLRDYDLDGWMQDFGEQAPDDGVYASGLPGVDEHNLYPVRYAQATYDAATAATPSANAIPTTSFALMDLDQRQFFAQGGRAILNAINPPGACRPLVCQIEQ